MSLSHSAMKPWSQADDDLDAVAPPVVGATESSAADASDARPSRADSGSWSTFLFRRSTAMMPMAALVPICLSALWALWAVFGYATGGVAHLLGILTMNLAAGALLIVTRPARRDRLHSNRDHFEPSGTAVSHQPAAAALPPDLAEIWKGVESHAASAEARVAELVEEQKRLSLELSLAATQRRQSAAILDSIADPVLVTDAFDQLVLANPAAGELFQFDRQAAHRRPISDVIADEKLLRTIRQVREADNRAAKRRIEQEIDGRVFAITLSPISPGEAGGGPAGGHHGVVVVLRDVTRDRAAAKMKSEFVAQVAHELRTPLSSIRAYVEMLVDGEAADEKTRREYYDIIQTSANRLGRLIDNILNISRIEAGTVRINKEPVAISLIVKEVVDSMRPQAEAKKITLTQELAPVVDRIQADRDLIYQAVLNLVSNAVKYTPAGGNVLVRMAGLPERGAMRIEVSDTGVGIPKEDLPRMFEKFFRVEANKAVAGGTGLGLNLVKQIVETVHGGEMSLVSEPGKGSTFAMTLPLVPQ